MTSSIVVDIPDQGPIEGVKVEVKTEQGSTSIIAYLGIPFVQPPIGHGRWRRPQKPAPEWKKEGKVRKSEWQRDPFQPLDLPRISNLMREDEEDYNSTPSYRDEHLMSEDCLYLNIWKPENCESGLVPVLVWVYGGGFQFGSTSTPITDGAKLASKTGCIVVSISYRVGVFGFLGSRQLAFREGRESEFGTGNYGLLDIVAGLEWIQDKIRCFKGDPNNVTAFGESAGAIALHYLMVSPYVQKNLFHRVALFSGTIVSVLPRTMPSAQATFDTLLEKVGIKSDLPDHKKVEILQDMSAETIQNALLSLPGVRPRSEYIINPNKGRPKDRMSHNHKDLRFEASSLCGPVWDGIFVPTDILQRMESSAINGEFRNGNQGILLSHTADEGTMFSMGMGSKAGIQRILQSFAPESRKQIENLYGIQSLKTNDSAKATGSTILGDYIFLAPVNRLTFDLSKQNRVPIYRYVWSHRPSSSLLRSSINYSSFFEFASNAGSWHSSELPFLFGNDGTEKYIVTRKGYPIPNPLNRQNGKFSKDQVGFTIEEHKLSNQLINHLNTFARGKSPWRSIQEGNSMDFNVMGYDNMPSLGGSTPEAMRKLSSYAETGDEDHKIEIQERPLSSILALNAPIDPNVDGNCGASNDRIKFWTDKSYKQTILYYYGDEKIRYIP